MEALANITSHNARAVQIRKFVSNPPTRANTLRLVTAEEPAQTLGEWDVTQARNNGSLSLEISALLEEHCTTIQRHTEAVLGWTIGDTKVVSSKRLRARYTPPTDEEGGEGDGLAFEALGINGTTLGQVVQMQRHLEVRERTSNTFVHGLMQTALQLNGQLQAQLQDSYNRIHELQQQQIDAAAAVVADYQDQMVDAAPAEAGAVDPAAEARTQALQVVTGIAVQYGPTLIQAALARLMSPQSPIQLAPPAPAPTPPSSPTPPAAPTAPAAAAAVPTVAPVAAAPAAPPTRSATRAQRAPTRPARAAAKRSK
jgi:hypothetical protein